MFTLATRRLPLALIAAALPLSLTHAQVAQPRAAQAAPVAQQRVLPLEGGQNFRDLGGYRASDGRTVKWGLLYRSGAMNNLTLKDYETLRARGIRSVCDFRDTRERAAAPVQWPAGAKPAVFADDYEMDSNFRALMKPGLTGEQAAALMAEGYRDIPLRFAGQYKRMFAQLAAGNAPLAFNCSAGKDRTGVAAALLLTALGVPYATVMEDYLLSNQYFKPDRMKADPQAAEFAKRVSPDALKAMMGVDRRYLDAAFDALRSRPGGLEGYYRNELGVDDAMRKALRARYLERA
ncbi:tyrosine-protein phosphatase [Sphingomonas sp. CCH5-D11]|uniref:tyrosine-protein phosphatase n=1 Tax=Sphingomonas sp. CCH5-D11 TaxID=1768786 RepID=UPI000831E57D|nr:tyrosine-protein phosphatase [Sphingomonas sp. CCH5-D11]